jgi:dTDP-4-dehydrorhamnose 3,5-epimerase
MGPPAEGYKLVIVIEGTVLDVLLDLRAGSPVEMKTCEWQLCAGSAVLVAPGVAHGFCVLSESAILGYLVSSEYQESADLGVRWDSVGISWPCCKAVVSARDLQLPRARDFVTPFSYSP